jgi:hypothetical protein
MIRLGQELRVEDWLRQGLIGLACEICKNDTKPAEVINGQSVFIKDKWFHVANLFYLCQKSYKASPQGSIICCDNRIGTDYNSVACGSCGRYWNNASIAKLVDEVFSAELAKARGDLLPQAAAITPPKVNKASSSS